MRSHQLAPKSPLKDWSKIRRSSVLSIERYRVPPMISSEPAPMFGSAETVVAEELEGLTGEGDVVDDDRRKRWLAPVYANSRVEVVHSQPHASGAQSLEVRGERTLDVVDELAEADVGLDLFGAYASDTFDAGGEQIRADSERPLVVLSLRLHALRQNQGRDCD